MSGAPPLEGTRLKKRIRRFLGRYELIGELARGGMGTVYLARHGAEAGFQRLFAIKVMHPHLAAETEFVDMLRDEARIAARIHHPNVVSIVDLGSIEDVHYVVMEYVEGPALGTLLRRTGETRSIEHVVSVVIDALEGLHAAHTLTNDEGEQLHLVHRDVSPQNILVGTDGLGRITDFGVAKAESRIASTRPGVRKGKLAFMPPEQIRDGDNVDLRADVWAAGVVLWTALTGKHLFKADNDASTVLALLTKEIPPPSTEGWKPPPLFDEVVLRALDRNPETRFSSALEMAEALRRVASASGLVCSKHQVAKWVTETFGEELALRRQAIREAAQRGRDDEKFNEASQVTNLSSLPAMSSTPHAAPDGMVNTPGAAVPGATGSYASTVIEPRVGESVSPPPTTQLTGATPVSFSGGQNRKRTWIAIGGLGVLLVGASALMIGRTSSSEHKAAAAPAVSSTEPLKADLPKTTTQGQPSPLPRNDDASTNEAAGTPSKKRPQWRPPPRVPPRASAAGVPKEPKTPAQEPVSKPRPQSAGEGLEKNPYLRR
jgi:eukaryotic-like serine/threonine-protein kinase